MSTDAVLLTDADGERQRLVRQQRAGALLSSPLLQLVGSLLIGVLGASLIRHAFLGSAPEFDPGNTAIGTSLSVLGGLVIYRKVTSLPGTAALINTLPAFAVSYVIFVALFSALRIDFSRQEFVLSFILTLTYMALLGAAAARARRPAFGYVAGGAAGELLDVTHVDWVEFTSPAEAAEFPELALAGDLQDEALSPEWERFLAEAAISGRRVYNARQLRESLIGRVEIRHLSENAFGHLAPDSIYAPLKLYIDVAAAFIVLVLLAPLLLLTGLLIRLGSPGPAIFAQERMGYRGKVFTMYKFRSMRQAAPEAAGLSADMTRNDDARITWLGRFIRKTRIDELPQLVNILKGEMSWIGPRPETVRLSRWYEAEIPFYRYRHIVRPGITGWAQVRQGHVTSVTDVSEKLQYDFFYVKNFSPWLDFLIAALTVRVMLTGLGAK